MSVERLGIPRIDSTLEEYRCEGKLRNGAIAGADIGVNGEDF